MKKKLVIVLVVILLILVAAWLLALALDKSKDAAENQEPKNRRLK